MHLKAEMDRFFDASFTPYFSNSLNIPVTKFIDNYFQIYLIFALLLLLLFKQLLLLNLLSILNYLGRDFTINF